MKCNNVYACWAIDDSIRYNSTSGGIFTILAEQIIANGGIVYGAAFNNNFDVEHIRVETNSGLIRLRGSKYVESNAYVVYESVKKDLENNKLVLFSGTPCQIAALKITLGKKYNKLISIDVVCHGVVTPKLWRDYRDSEEHRYGSPIVKVNFRYKKPNWPTFSMYIKFQNGKTLVRDKRKDPYLLLFSRDISVRAACHNCQFTSTIREADITIGDFWGIRPKNESERQYDKGISMCLLNTDKGEKLFNSIKQNIYYLEHDMEEAIHGNACLSAPYPTHPQRSSFFADYIEKGYNYAVKKYCVPEHISIRTRLREATWFNPILNLYRMVRGKKDAQS